jgi:ABC-type branched-subunit amino acid transport system ATPase component
MNPRAGLDVERLTVRYGGATAVADLTLVAPLGQVTGLIGPNGAGKTTTFNACGGLTRAAAGSVTLFGQSVTTLGPAARARLGLGRTFQRTQLCESLSVLDNVAIAGEARHAGRNPLRQLLAAHSHRQETLDATRAALEACGIAHLRERRVADLATGQRRLVELARVIAGGYRMLLLDEPSSGLDAPETAAFGNLLSELVERREIGILLVEHDMSLVMSVCRDVYVLDFGRLVFSGTPSDVRASAVVRAAYLGDEDGLELETAS